MANLHRPCPVCECRRGKILHSLTFELPGDHPLANGYDVVSCADCGFGFADVEASQSTYDRYYQSLSKYADTANSSGAGTSAWDQERLNGLAAAIAAFDPDHSHRIVDVGCASGGLLKTLHKSGFENLCGIDPSQNCVENTKSGGFQAFQGSLFHPPPGIGTFDGIVLSHVLEHVRDLRLALEALTPLLNPDGWIYIEVPDATRYKKHVFAPFQDFNTEHINHFSPIALNNLLSVCHFKQISVGSKEILSAPHRPYPAIFAFARKHEATLAIQRDEALPQALDDYIKISEAILARIRTRIETLVGGGSPIAIWGTGQLTMKLLLKTALQRANIVAFIDSNPLHHGKLLRGIPVLAPQDFHDKAATILIGSMITTASIQNDIKRLGLCNPVVTLE